VLPSWPYFQGLALFAAEPAYPELLKARSRRGSDARAALLCHNGCYNGERMDQERAIEFILDQQAKLAAGLVELQARFVELQSGLNDLRSIVTTVVGVQQGFGQALLQTQEQLQRTNEQVSRVAEAQLLTEERLNTLIAIVDGIIRRPPPQ